MRLLLIYSLILTANSFCKPTELRHDIIELRDKTSIAKRLIRLDTVFSFTGVAVDSFNTECSRYAECICFDNVRFKVIICPDSMKLKDKIIGVYIRCFEDSYNFRLYKDSTFFITVTTKFTPRTLIKDKYESDNLRQYWCTKIEPANLK